MQIILKFIGSTIKLSAMYLKLVSNWYHSIKTLLTLFLKFKTFLKRIQFRSSLHRTIKLSKLFKQLLMNYCNKFSLAFIMRWDILQLQYIIDFRMSWDKLIEVSQLLILPEPHEWSLLTCWQFYIIMPLISNTQVLKKKC